MKIFISLPMSGYSDEDIQNRLSKISSELKEKFGNKIELIDNFNYIGFNSINEAAIRIGNDTINASIWYLGRAIQLLSKVDAIYFAPGWENAKGCRIEHAVAESYNIKIIDI